ncbi:hypothetical protein CANMA_003963 [Candida margitis]|uniref:uncharacterized protein n=1 Tax=Candida margitis TaxID=1775924 RepID=UPI002226A4D3|nr:uncharacterized protein CANMA_003963 [Candida margitis]KAI5960701.1 hypothetical protein CANMA_003963 [Candida margitis]
MSQSLGTSIIDKPSEEEDFPFPVSIVTTDFKNFKNDSQSIDQFLYKNHRFTSLDVLIKELRQLSSSLNQSLLDIVNHDYTDFIELGKSINGGDELINSISEDLKQFKIQLHQYDDKFNQMDTELATTLSIRQHLIELKSIAKLQLLLHDQIEMFDRLTKEELNLASLQKITATYLSIISVDKHLQNLIDDELPQSKLQQQYLNGKVTSVIMEFKGYMRSLLGDVKSKRITEPNLVTQILNIQNML